MSIFRSNFLYCSFSPAFRPLYQNYCIFKIERPGAFLGWVGEGLTSFGGCFYLLIQCYWQQWSCWSKRMCGAHPWKAYGWGPPLGVGLNPFGGGAAPLGVGLVKNLVFWNCSKLLQKSWKSAKIMLSWQKYAESAKKLKIMLSRQ